MSALVARTLAFAAAMGLAGLPGASSVAVAAAPKKDPTVVAEELGARARDAYRSRRFDRAIELYLEAYEAAPDAGFLFNIAFIYDKKLEELDLARDYYRRVTAFPDANPDLVAKAEGRLAELALPPVEPPPGPEDPPPGGGEKPPVEPPVEGPNLVPWVLIGGGGLLLGTGVAFGAVASGTESDFHAATDNDRRRELQSTGNTQAVLADVFMLAGVAALGTGVVLWLLDDDEAPGSSGQVHVAPVFFEGGAALTVGGSL